MADMNGVDLSSLEKILKDMYGSDKNSERRIQELVTIAKQSGNSDKALLEATKDFKKSLEKASKGNGGISEALKALDSNRTKNSVSAAFGIDAKRLMSSIKGGENQYGGRISGVFENFASSIPILNKFSTGITSVSSKLGPWGAALGIVASAAKYVAESFWETAKMNTEIFKSGVNLEHGLTGLADFSTDVGLSMSNTVKLFGKFASSIGGPYIERFKAAMNTATVSTTSGAISLQTYAAKFGIGISELTDVTAEMMEQQLATGKLNRMNGDDIAKEASMRIATTTRWSQAVGMSADKLRAMTAESAKSVDASIFRMTLTDRAQKVFDGVLTGFAALGDNARTTLTEMVSNPIIEGTAGFQQALSVMGSQGGSFASSLKKMQQAVQSGDQAGADAAMQEMIKTTGNLSQAQWQQMAILGQSFPEMKNFMVMLKDMQGAGNRMAEQDRLDLEEAKGDLEKVKQIREKRAKESEASREATVQFGNIMEKLSDLGRRMVVNFFGGMGNVEVMFRKVGDWLGSFDSMTKQAGDPLEMIKNVISKIGEGITTLWQETIGKTEFGKSLESFIETVVTIGNVVSVLVKPFSLLISAISSLVEWIDDLTSFSDSAESTKEALTTQTEKTGQTPYAYSKVGGSFDFDMSPEAKERRRIESEQSKANIAQKYKSETKIINQPQASIKKEQPQDVGNALLETKKQVAEKEINNKTKDQEATSMLIVKMDELKAVTEKSSIERAKENEALIQAQYQTSSNVSDSITKANKKGTVS